MFLISIINNKCVYGRCVPEWPDHILQRSMCWATLCLVRCAIVDKIPGGLSFVFTQLLLTFDVLVGGILLPGATGPFMFCAKFAGMLADLIGHQSLTAWKGPNAVRPCTCCANLSARKAGPGSDLEVSLAEHDERRFVQSTNEEIFLMLDNLAAVVADGRSSQTKINKLQTELGFNHEPLGILMNMAMRHTYRPAEHQLTDWMHVFCQDGVGNTAVALILDRLSKARPAITNAMAQTFLDQCVIPIEHGKIKGEWIEPKRLKNNSLTAFASMLLSIVPCIALMLQMYDIAKQLPEEVECFLMLDQIFGILTLGPRRSMEYIDRLRTLIVGHHRLFARLYPDRIKPKLHHSHHIVSSMLQLGFLLACFVTERKHRLAKQFALNTWRHFEHTTLLDCLHQQCEYLATGHDLFAAEFLVHPNAVRNHAELETSTVAVCHVGTLHASDVICTKDGVVGRVESFWRHSGGPVFARVLSFACVDGDCTVRDMRQTTDVIVEVSAILGACVWCLCRPQCAHVMKVRLPPTLLL